MIRHVKAVVRGDAPVSGSPLLVLIILAEAANEQGECRLAATTIADRARLTERNARKALSALVEAGLVARKIGGGRGRATVYRLDIGALEGPETPSDATGFNHGRTRQGFAETLSEKVVNPVASDMPSDRKRLGDGGDARTRATALEILHPSTTTTDPAADITPPMQPADLWAEVVYAAGHEPGDHRLAGGWQAHVAMRQVMRWRTDLGLTDAEIIGTVRGVAERKIARDRDPPGSPRYFDAAMQRVAGDKLRKLSPIAGGSTDDRPRSKHADAQHRNASAWAFSTAAVLKRHQGG